MPDVSIARAGEPYAPNGEVEKNRKSALRLVHQLLALEGVTKRHLSEQLKIGLWKWTEAEGVGHHPKFNTRFFSTGVMAQRGPANINHEHVWTLKNHVKALRERSWTLDELETHLQGKGVACIVTVQEHGLLSGSKLDGWARYEEVGIPVFDRATRSWLDFAASPGGSLIGRTQQATVRTGARVDVAELIVDRAKPEVALLYTSLMRMTRFASAVAAPSFKESGEISAYFRIHDALIEEPTPAVAFPHWTGRIAFGLQEKDLPVSLSRDSRVNFLKNKKYGVSVKVKDDESLALAEELLFLALEKLRADFGPW